MQQHHRRMREQRRKPVTAHKKKRAKPKQLSLRHVTRIQIIQMAEMDRFHYEVWADFDNGNSELLSRSYIHGLGNAVQLATDKWGQQRIELDRWHPKTHKPLLVIRERNPNQ